MTEKNSSSSSLLAVGEIANKYGITVRALQFYDRKGILSPHEFSEGGRRLYTEEDEKHLSLILKYKSLGLPLKEIQTIMNEENPSALLLAFLKKSSEELDQTIKEEESQKEKIGMAIANLEAGKNLSFSLEPIITLRERQKLHHIHQNILLTGILMDLFIATGIISWILWGYWWIFVGLMSVAIVGGILISLYYYQKTVFTCPNCGTTFRPSFFSFFFSYHNSISRRLLCPKCHKKRLCLEKPKNK